MSIGNAHFRYRLAVGFLTFGLIAIVSLLPLSFVLYGHPLGFIGPVLLFAGSASVLLATALGLYNYLSLRRKSSPTESKN